VFEATVKIVLCCRFRRPGKAIGEAYGCWWRICREIIFFRRFDHSVLRFISICDLLLTLPHIITYKIIWTTLDFRSSQRCGYSDSLPTIRRNVLLPSSGPKSNPRN
jgi:hypothetical protein